MQMLSLIDRWAEDENGFSVIENSKLTNGGAGSGNFGHSGRKGKVGGSSKSNYIDYSVAEMIRFYALQGLSDGKGGRSFEEDNPDVLFDNNVKTEEQKKAIFAYTTDGSSAINSYLRDGLLGTKTSPTIEEAVEEIDSCIQGELGEDIIVYRAVNFTKDFRPPEVGDVIEDKAYLSTTISPSSSAISPGSDVMVLKVKKGTKALYIGENTSAVTYFEGRSSTMNESELLFPRDAKIRITKDYSNLTSSQKYDMDIDEDVRYEGELYFDKKTKNYIKATNGGKGSGNFGHSGREGKVGGSSKRDSYNLEVEGDGPKGVADVHEELRNITDWNKYELSMVIPYFGNFANTERVQDYLRGGDDAPISDYAMASDCVRTMKEKMARTEFPEDTILYRGMMIRNDRMDRVENNGFSYSGFQSTSLVGNDASRIIQEYKESGNYDPQFYTPVLLKIHAKKGQHFAASYMDVEHEIVLPPNIRMNVKNKARTSLGMLYEVDYDEE